MTPAALQLKKAITKEKRERLEKALFQQVRAVGLPVPKCNGTISGTSKAWLYDLVWYDERVCVEIHGLLYAEGERGGHQTPQGIERDTSKLCEAVTLGWRYLAVTAKQIKDGRAIAWIERLFT